MAAGFHAATFLTSFMIKNIKNFHKNSRNDRKEEKK